MDINTKTIVTHEYCDLDALLAAFLVGEFLCQGSYHLRFYPANTELDFISEDFDFAVDFGKQFDPKRGLFDHHQIFEFESAVSLIHTYLREKNIDTNLEHLIDYVHWQDLTGNAVRYFTSKKLPQVEVISLHNVLAALRDNGLSDQEIFGIFRIIFQALRKRQEKWLATRDNLHKVCTLFSEWIAIVKEGTGAETPFIWEHMPKVKIVIYKDGNNLGVIRRDGETIDLQSLRDHINEEGWFYHLSGFIAAHGTRKAMSRKKSRYTPEDLASMVTDIFGPEIQLTESSLKEP